MDYNTAYFSDIGAMAAFCAALMREGVTFNVQFNNGLSQYEVKMIGN